MVLVSDMISYIPTYETETFFRFFHLLKFITCLTQWLTLTFFQVIISIADTSTYIKVLLSNNRPDPSRPRRTRSYLMSYLCMFVWMFTILNWTSTEWNNILELCYFIKNFKIFFNFVFAWIEFTNSVCFCLVSKTEILLPHCPWNRVNIS